MAPKRAAPKRSGAKTSAPKRRRQNDGAKTLRTACGILEKFLILSICKFKTNVYCVISSDSTYGWISRPDIIDTGTQKCLASLFISVLLFNK